MQNNFDGHCKPSLFKENGKEFAEQFKNYISVLINSKGVGIHAEYSNKITDFLDGREKFASEDAQNSFKKYFDDQWIRCEKKWKAVYTCELAHFGNTTTQRAESGHAALKTEMSEHQSLSFAFSRIATFIESVERNYDTKSLTLLFLSKLD